MKPSSAIAAVLVVALAAQVMGVPPVNAHAVPSAGAVPKKPTTVVALTFDDGDASHVQVAQLLRKHGMRGTFYINSGTLGEKGKLTRKQLRAIAKAGHEIGGHTLTHVRLSELPLDQQWPEMCDDRRALLKMGFSVRTFAYPYGAWDSDARQTARDCGYNGARGVGGLATASSCEGCPATEPFRPKSLYLVRTPGSIRETTTLKQMEQLVLRAEKKGGLLPLVFHRMCDGCDVYSMRKTTFTKFLDWLATREKHGTAVKPLGTVIGGPVRGVPTS